MWFSRLRTIFLICWFCPLLTLAEPLRIMTENLPPLSFYDEEHQLTGLAVEMVLALQRDLGDTTPIEVLPWARAMEEIEHKSNHMLFSVARMPSREDKFAWVGPIIVNQVYLYRHPDTVLPDASLEDAKTWQSIAVIRNYPQVNYLSERGFNNLKVVNTPDLAIRQLLHQRVDAVAIGQLVVPSLLEAEGYAWDALTPTAIKLFDFSLYLAFSKDTDPAVLARWQQALERLQASEVMPALLDKYHLTPVNIEPSPRGD